MKSLVCRSLTVLFAALLTGCASLSGHSGQASSVPPVVTSSQAMHMGFSSYWIRDMGLTKGEYVGSVTKVGDMLIVEQQPQHLVVAFSIDNGDYLWSRVIGNPTDVLYRPMAHNGKIYFNTETRLYAFDQKTGKPLSYFEFPFATTSGATLLSGNRAAFGSASGRVFVVDLDSFEIAWQYMLPGAIRAQPVTNPQRSELAAGDTNGNYILFASASGNIRWQRRSFGAIVCPLVFDGPLVLVASSDQSLYAENVLNGKDVWVYPTQYPLTMSPSVFGKTVYLPVPGQDLLAIDQTTGKLKWSLQHVAQPVMPVSGGLLAVAGDQLQVIKTDSGTIDSRMTVKGLIKTIAGPQGSLILINKQGVMQRLNPAK